MSAINVIKNYQLNTKSLVTINEPIVTNRLLSQINNYIIEGLGLGYRYAIPQTFSLLFDSTTDLIYINRDLTQLRGRFTQRVSQYLFKSFNKKLTEQELSHIGNIASSDIIRDRTFKVEFSNAINWNAGDFGDDGSCYWRENQMAQQVLVDNDFRAVKLYSIYGHGVARAWILYADRVPVLFNPYGESIEVISNVIRQVTGLKSKVVRIRNKGNTDTILYINRAVGIAFYDDDDGEPEDNLDFQIDISWYFNNHICTQCGDTLSYFHIYFYEDELDILCKDCYLTRGGYL